MASVPSASADLVLDTSCQRDKLNVYRGCNSVVECNLAKVEVVGSNPITRST